MSALFRCVPALALTALGASLLASPAEAAECTYTDLHGTFEVRVDCEGLKDHSNLGNEQKRMWLAGTWGQMNIIEVPPPYKQDAGQLDLIMSNLGRVYTERRSPGGVQETTVAGQEARVVLEHKMRTSSRSWVFNWQGRNLIMRAVAFGKKKERMATLDTMSAALMSTFAPADVKVEAPGVKGKERVRDRQVEAPAAAPEVAPEDAPAKGKTKAKAAKDAAAEAATDVKDAATETATDVKDAATETATDVKDAATEAAPAAKAKGKAAAKAAKDTAEDTAEAAGDDAEDAADKGEDAAEAKAKETMDEGAEAAEDAIEEGTKGPKGQ